MLTPALLILAAGSLIATALVRLARIVDRVRSLAGGDGASIRLEELARHETRARLALGAITVYFVAVALFVLAGAAIALDHLVQGQLTWLPVSLTLAGMLLLVAGAGAMAVESRASGELIAADIAHLRRRASAEG